jgi:NTE family protein
MGLFGPRSIGLALGGGSVRGLAHVGVLTVLEREGIRPAAIAGTSMGAIVGAMYAAGHSPAAIEQVALGLDVRGLLSLADWTRHSGALMSGDKVASMLAEYLPATFEELQIPFGCTSVDLVAGEGVRHTSGDLVKAVRASMSVPMAFLPVRDAERMLVDGFLTEPVPVAFVRSLGVRVVVAVEVTGSGRIGTGDIEQGDGNAFSDLRASIKGERHRPRGTSSMDIAAATIEMLERSLTAYAVRDADVVISPDVHVYAGHEFAFAAPIIAAGEQATEQALPRIKSRARL